MLSIFTVIAQRLSDAPVGSGRPVSGATGGTFGFAVVGGVAAAFFTAFLPPPHPESAMTTASATTSLNFRECIAL